MKYFYAKVKSKKEMSGIPFGWNVAGEMNFLKGKVVIGYINGLAFIPTEMIFRKKIKPAGEWALHKDDTSEYTIFDSEMEMLNFAAKKHNAPELLV